MVESWLAETVAEASQQDGAADADDRIAPVALCMILAILHMVCQMCRFLIILCALCMLAPPLCDFHINPSTSIQSV